MCLLVVSLAEAATVVKLLFQLLDAAGVPTCFSVSAGVSVFAVAGFVALSVFVTADAVVLSAVEVDPAGAVVVLAAGLFFFYSFCCELLAASVAAAFYCAARLVSEASRHWSWRCWLVAFTFISSYTLHVSAKRLPIVPGLKHPNGAINFVFRIEP